MYSISSAANFCLQSAQLSEFSATISIVRIASAVAICACVAAMVFVARFQYKYNWHKRRILDNHQSLFYRDSTVHAITALVPDGVDLQNVPYDQSTDLRPQVDKLHEAVLAAGGKRIYTGRVVVATGASQQVSEELHQGVRVVLISQWESQEAFQQFRSALQGKDSGWIAAWSTGFQRSPVMHCIFPVLLGLWKVQSMLGMIPTYDVKTASTQAFTEKTASVGWQPDPISHGELATHLCGATKLESEQPVVICNWQLRGTKEQAESNKEYGQRMMHMLAQNGGGMMDVGGAFRLDGEPDWKWQQIACVHYPDRAFFSSLVKSDWMISSLKGKALGDTFITVTVPFSSTVPVLDSAQ